MVLKIKRILSLEPTDHTPAEPGEQWRISMPLRDRK
jgi:hypothetical protein